MAKGIKNLTHQSNVVFGGYVHQYYNRRKEMKKANELRVGNYFQWIEIASMGIGVDVITKDNHYTYEDFKEPIPLTEEWLVKFGSDSVGCIKLPTGSTLQITMNKYGCVIWNGNLSECVEIGDCNHVHQLQNLYFALTGEELN